MWGWIGNDSLAASPSRSMSFWAPSIDRGLWALEVFERA